MTRFLEWLLGMNPGKLGGADTYFPRFSAEYNDWVVLGLFVLFAALVALTVISYLREGDHPRRRKLAIAGVRIAVLVLIFVVLLQPDLVLRYKKDHYYTAVVLIDDSLSMGLTDRYTDDEQRRAFADALGVSPAGLQGMTRQEIVRRLLLREGGPLAELAEKHRLLLLRFSTANPGRDPYTKDLRILPARQASGVETGRIVEEIRSAFDSLKAAGHETDLSSALRDAAERLRGQRVAGVVLVSDGQVTGAVDETGNRLGSALAHLRRRGIKVVSVGVGDEVPPRNVALVQLQAPGEVRQGSFVEFKAYLTHRNCDNRTVELSLLRRPVSGGEWSPTGVGEMVQLGEAAEEGASEPQVATLKLEVNELGEYEYRAEVAPVEQEFTEADNAATAKVRVSDEKIKILFVSADAGFEFVYLRDLLLRSPDRYEVSVWQQNADKEFNQESSSPGMKLTRLPQKPEELFRYEVVMLYDPTFTRDGFDQPFIQMLETFVADHHGGLCYIASNKNSDINLVGTLSAFDPLENLLPVQLDRQALNIAERIAQAEPVAYPVQPTASGQDHPILRMGGTAEDTLQIWSVLPGVYWSHPVRRLKPLATTLAVSSDASRVVTSSGSEREPLIAVQYYGKGRTLYMGFDETWRWRALANGTFHREFWHNVISFLAAGRLQKKRIVLTTGADRFHVGDQMRIRAEVYEKDYSPLEEEEFPVTIVNEEDDSEQTVVMKLDPKRKGHYEATVTLKETGAFRLTAMRDNPEYAGEVAEKVVRVELPAEEFRHPESDPTTLKTIAGPDRYLMAHEADRVPAIISSPPMTVFNDVPHSMWDTPLTIAVVVLLLGTEWVLRKKYNMA
jgi:hypothetical protein